MAVLWPRTGELFVLWIRRNIYLEGIEHDHWRLVPCKENQGFQCNWSRPSSDVLKRKRKGKKRKKSHGVISVLLLLFVSSPGMAKSYEGEKKKLEKRKKKKRNKKEKKAKKARKKKNKEGMSCNEIFKLSEIRGESIEREWAITNHCLSNTSKAAMFLFWLIFSSIFLIFFLGCIVYEWRLVKKWNPVIRSSLLLSTCCHGFFSFFFFFLPWYFNLWWLDLEWKRKDRAYQMKSNLIKSDQTKSSNHPIIQSSDHQIIKSLPLYIIRWCCAPKPAARRVSSSSELPFLFP